jgi:hypothetical protein
LNSAPFVGTRPSTYSKLYAWSSWPIAIQAYQCVIYFHDLSMKVSAFAFLWQNG